MLRPLGSLCGDTPLEGDLCARIAARSRQRILFLSIVLLLPATLVSCRGGVTAGSAVSPSVTVSPSSAQVAVGAIMQFTATVNNSADATVDWQVNGLPGGTPTIGNITAIGPTAASYSAPINIPNPAGVTVRAVLRADPTKFGDANVTVMPLPPPTLTIAPLNPSVLVGGILQFTGSVQNSSSGVLWQVNNISGGNGTVGTISPSGTYKPPDSVPGFPITVTAVLIADPTTTSSTTVTVTSALTSASVSISPPTASVGVNQSAQFTAVVRNSTSPVIWMVNGTVGGSTALGKITPSGAMTGIYTAPSSVPSPATVTLRAVLQSDQTTSGASVVTVSNGFGGMFSWRNDAAITGQNQQEAILTPAAVSASGLTKKFACPVDGYVYAQPLYAPNVFVPGDAIHNVVYVATEGDSVYAFDADANQCEQLWHTSFLGATASPACQNLTDCLLNLDTDNLGPQVGITGTPVIDSQTATMYVAAETKENGLFFHRLHALSIVTGLDTSPPTTIQATIRSGGGGAVTFNPQAANQRAALQLVRDSAGKAYILIAYGGYNDNDPDHGWLFAYDAASLQQVAAFNTTPDADPGGNAGIWQSGAAPSADAEGNVFVVSADGKFDATGDSSSNDDYGQSVLKLQMDSGSASFKIKDSFTPSNLNILASQGKEFGSTGVLLLPASAGSVSHPHLAIAAGKEGKLYLLDRDQLGGYTAGTDTVVQTVCVNSGTSSTGIFGTPAYFQGTNTVYVAGAYDGLKAFPLAGGLFSQPATCPALAAPSSQSSEPFPFPGASPTISSNGSMGAIVWALDTSGFGVPSPAILHAYDASNLANELYAGPAAAHDPNAAGPAVKFTVPTIANGRVFIGTQTELSVFGLP